MPKSNINEGKLLLLDEIYSSCLKALEASLQKLPFGQLALIYIDDETKCETTLENIKKSFGDRSEPCIFSGSKTLDSLQIQLWLCEPSKRCNDLCIVTMKHRSNGLETKVVVYILPAACEECGHSNEDPVIASRATAMLVVARGTSILGEVRNVEIPGPTQQLLKTTTIFCHFLPTTYISFTKLRC